MKTPLAHFASLCLFLFGWHALAQDKNGIDSTENGIRAYEGRLETVKKSFSVGDINGDKTKDSIFATYKRVLSADGTWEKECGRNICYAAIKSNAPVPEISVEAYSVWIKPVTDTNGDGRDEILVFRELERFIWGRISLYSYNGKEWVLLNEVDAFLGDDAAYENRIVKSGAKFYILEDVWNKEYTLIYRRKRPVAKATRIHP